MLETRGLYAFIFLFKCVLVMCILYCKLLEGLEGGKKRKIKILNKLNTEILAVVLNHCGEYA